ncbi:hypothetical protein DSAG12_03814 [Promethearchaeum syntrophicum]|uniref:TFIIEalpha/SarR/Rpc3 HTH domain-containing protein n=1 Tax=Promethearchaeum syntrophicum TaxID=2594042 RepID=A0A5B9DGX2_9ARCH|nr:hypothetical protein [Candidatus Prometheoarchaeum syntrophicum]QEE17976.1 TFIIE alpha subunit [Candidatus Prometheoarchaeum syntrophicum]
MTQMKNIDFQSWIPFHSKLTKYFDQILEFNIHIGEARGTSKKFSIIMTYIMICGKITQNQLKLLTNYSLSNISSALNILLGARLIKKNRISGTHKYYYYIANNIVDTNRKTIRILLKNLSDNVNFLSDIKKELIDLRQLKLSGTYLISKQVDFMIHDFESYKSLILKLEKSFDNHQTYIKNRQFSQLNSETYDSYEVIKFDPKIIEIENRIINFLQDTLLPPRKGPSRSIILPLFFTRGMLTQNQLKNISGLSIGAISEGLKELEKKNLIRISVLRRNEKGKKIPRIYLFRSFSLAATDHIYNLFNRIIEWKPRFQRMQTSLIEEEDTLESLKGYSEINFFINMILGILPKYEIFNKIIQNLRDS